MLLSALTSQTNIKYDLKTLPILIISRCISKNALKIIQRPHKSEKHSNDMVDKAKESKLMK